MKENLTPEQMEVPDGYLPIRDYAVIGNCRSIAHVSTHGSVDWLCLPHFSSPSVFAAILDAARGGRFAVRPRGIERVERRYLGASNVLETRFHCAQGEMTLIDFMPVLSDGEPDGELHPEHEIGRIARCESGHLVLDCIYQPRPDYARHVPRLRKRGKLGWLWDYDGQAAYLQSDMELSPRGEGCVAASEQLSAGEQRSFSFAYSNAEMCAVPPLRHALKERLQTTLRWWTDWVAQCTYEGPYKAEVVRSCLALKLLDYALSGAVVAAPTTSLPEGKAGARNWDYRYCWLRDTSLVLQSFIDLGFTGESQAFLGWLLHATRLTWPYLQVLYNVFGETRLNEYELDSLEGYQGRGPVRIGNAAHQQLQLDIYGEVVLTAYSFVERGGSLDDYERRLLVGFGDSVRELWRKPDKSIWEVRAPPRQNTYSKLMCWVALDRLLKLNASIGLGIAEEEYRGALHEMRAEIDAKGYDAELNSYVGYYGGKDPDASLLLLARYGYVSERDPRMMGTVRYIEQRLSKDGFLFRYPPGGEYDGVPGSESLFAICSFWLVDYLARLGEISRADTLFRRLLALGNDVGLYAEEFEPDSLKPAGNFPQAFTHVGLITAALALKQAGEGKRGQEIAK